MDEKIININDWLNEFPNDVNDIDRPDSFYRSFIAWNKISQEHFEKLQKIGKILSTIKRKEESAITNNYWDADALIDFGEYPYHGCDLYKSKEGNCYYLIYEEYCGHVPETRCRLMQKRLIKYPLA